MQLILLSAPGGDAEWHARLVDSTGWPLESDSGEADAAGTAAGDAPPVNQIRLINEQIFSALQSTWYHVENLPLGGEPSTLPHDLDRQLKSCGDTLNHLERWTCNDPAMCVLVPYWRQYIPGPVYVICVEHPCDVASRLQQTWRFPIAYGLALWEYYLRAALANTRDTRRLLISKESSATNLEASLSRLCKLLDLDFKVALQVETALKRVISCAPDISPRHDPDQLAFMNNSQTDLYRALCEDTVDTSGGALSHTARDMLQHYGRLRAGFDEARQERDALRRRALTEARPAEPVEHHHCADSPATTDAEIVDVTVYLHGMDPLELSCPCDNPILDQLLLALTRAGNANTADNELFYLELGDKTLYFPLSQLAAVETDHKQPEPVDQEESTRISIADSRPLALVPDSGVRGKSVAVLVLGCLLPQYVTCLDVIERTWASRRFTGIDIFYAIGSHFDPSVVSTNAVEKYIGRDAPSLSAFQTRQSGNVIACGCADAIHLQNDSLLRKRLIAFNHLASTNKYDFVYTVCASSYVDQSRLRDYVESVEDDMLFHGPVAICEFTGRPYVSGASMLFSIDMIKRIIADTYRIIGDNEGRFADDVAISSWIARHFSDTPEEQIVENILADRRPTEDNTFVRPPSVWMIDYVDKDPAVQVPVENAYHYHFKTDMIGQMAEFHQRFFG